MTPHVDLNGAVGLSVLALCGSLRVGSLNARLLDDLALLVPEHTFIRYNGLARLPIYNSDEEFPVHPEVARLRTLIETADAVVIASPEYNYSVPGGLKNAIDWASRPVVASCLARKPIGIMGAGPGRVGSARGQLALRQILLCTESNVLGAPEVNISDATALYDDLQGRARIARQLRTFWDALAVHIRATRLAHEPA